MVGNIGTLSWNNLTIICLRDQNHVFRVDEFFRLSTFVLGGTRYIMLDLYSTKFYIVPSALKSYMKAYKERTLSCYDMLGMIFVATAVLSIIIPGYVLVTNP